MKRRLFALLPFLLLCGCAAHRKPVPPKPQPDTVVLMRVDVGGKTVLSTGCIIKKGEISCTAPGTLTLKKGEAMFTLISFEDEP